MVTLVNDRVSAVVNSILKAIVLHCIFGTFAGLVSLEEMRAKQDSVIKARETQLAIDEKAARLDCESDGQRKRKKKKKKQVH